MAAPPFGAFPLCAGGGAPPKKSPMSIAIDFAGGDLAADAVATAKLTPDLSAPACAMDLAAVTGEALTLSFAFTGGAGEGAGDLAAGITGEALTLVVALVGEGAAAVLEATMGDMGGASFGVGGGAEGVASAGEVLAGGAAAPLGATGTAAAPLCAAGTAATPLGAAGTAAAPAANIIVSSAARSTFLDCRFLSSSSIPPI